MNIKIRIKIKVKQRMYIEKAKEKEDEEEEEDDDDDEEEEKKMPPSSKVTVTDNDKDNFHMNPNTQTKQVNAPSFPRLQARNNNRAILNHIPITALTLNHEIRRQIELPPMTRQAGTINGIHDVRIVSNNGNVIAPAHKLAVLTGLASHISLEDLHHVLFCVCWLGGGGAVTVGGDVDGLVVVVEEFEDVRGGRAVYDCGGDELVHCFVV